MAAGLVDGSAIGVLLAGCLCMSAAGQTLNAPSPRPFLSDELPQQLPEAIGIAIPCAKAEPYRLTLEEAKNRALSSSVIMTMASQQIAAKCHAMEAARKDYLPKLLNFFSYFHFDSDLGTVVTTPGIFNPATAISVPIIEQDATIYTAAAVQPITPLLKVREAVNIGAAEVETAEAERMFARRELTKGVEQLYFGLLAAQRIRDGLKQAEAGAQQLYDATRSSDAQISLVEVQQNVLTAETQVATLSEQLNQLIELPPCTRLELEDPPAPQIVFGCADEAISAAVATSPKLREARLQIEMADAAVRLAESDYVPNVNAYGLYVAQDATPIIQDDFTGFGLTATYVLEWGKKNDTLRSRKATLALARSNLRKETQAVELSTAKALHEAERAQRAFVYAQQLAELYRNAKLPTDPFQLKVELKAKLESGLGEVKAELDLRTAVAELDSLTGRCN
jgi:outer membrane protein TolC